MRPWAVPVTKGAAGRSQLFAPHSPSPITASRRGRAFAHRSRTAPGQGEASAGFSTRPCFAERIQTRVLQAVGRCTRALNDCSAVVVTGEDLPAYLIDRKRRSYLHPELQAELSFGIEQSTRMRVEDMIDNFKIFLANDTEWEEANESILQQRNEAIQAAFPAMHDLAAAVRFEIDWQKAMWDQDSVSAFESAREVLGKLDAPELRGYRALWHYLAGSAADQASVEGRPGFPSQARRQFGKAKEAASGIPWLTSLAHRTAPTPVPDDDDTTVMLQVERLEGYLHRLGTVQNRSYSARESEIRAGLRTGDRFEHAQALLGEHLGFISGKREVDASPDPWWRAGNTVFVFEDHADAKGDTSTLDAKKARQVASYPDWVRDHVAGAAEAEIVAVLVTPATKVNSGAVPHLPPRQSLVARRFSGVGRTCPRHGTRLEAYVCGAGRRRLARFRSRSTRSSQGGRSRAQVMACGSTRVRPLGCRTLTSSGHGYRKRFPIEVEAVWTGTSPGVWNVGDRIMMTDTLWGYSPASPYSISFERRGPDVSIEDLSLVVQTSCGLRREEALRIHQTLSKYGRRFSPALP